MYIFIMIIVLFFACIGLLQFIWSLITMTREKNDSSEYFLIIPKLDCDNAECKLRSSISRLRSFGKGRIICIISENDTEAVSICQRLKSDCPFVDILTTDDFIQIYFSQRDRISENI